MVGLELSQDAVIRIPEVSLADKPPDHKSPDDANDDQELNESKTGISLQHGFLLGCMERLDAKISVQNRIVENNQPVKTTTKKISKGLFFIR